MISVLLAITFMVMVLVVFCLLMFAFTESTPIPFLGIPVCLWLAFTTFSAEQYNRIYQKKQECEKHLTRTEKCVFIAVPESSLVEEIKEG